MQLHEKYRPAVWGEIDGERCPIGFKKGTYRLYRPDHVSCSNPSLADLSISKIK